MYRTLASLQGDTVNTESEDLARALSVRGCAVLIVELQLAVTRYKQSVPIHKAMSLQGIQLLTMHTKDANNNRWCYFTLFSYSIFTLWNLSVIATSYAQRSKVTCIWVPHRRKLFFFCLVRSEPCTQASIFWHLQF